MVAVVRPVFGHVGASFLVHGQRPYWPDVLPRGRRALGN